MAKAAAARAAPPSDLIPFGTRVTGVIISGGKKGYVFVQLEWGDETYEVFAPTSAFEGAPSLRPGTRVSGEYREVKGGRHGGEAQLLACIVL